MAAEEKLTRALVDAGVIAGNRVGTVFASHVIPRPHEEVDALIAKFAKNLKNKEVIKEEVIKEEAKKETKNKKTVKEE